MSRDEFKAVQAIAMRDERLVLGLSRLEVSRALGCAVSTVLRWERGETSPGVYDVKRLRRLYRGRAVHLGLSPVGVADAITALGGTRIGR